MSQGWIGVDLDGTLAHYEYGDKDWSPTKIGALIPEMQTRVRRWLAEGREVRIFTARVCSSSPQKERFATALAIGEWCVEHLGRSLAITCEKDYHMIELWDDRAVGVEPNTGRPLNPSSRGLA